MRMIDLGAGTGSSQRGIINNNNNNRRIIVLDTTTSVDCSSTSSVREQVTRSSSFRSLLGCMLPYCCGFPPNFFQSSSSSDSSSCTTTLSVSSDTTDSTTSTTTSSTTVVTGTFFGYRKGRVSFCLQDHSRSSSPLLLLEFAVQTAYLAKEMQHGQLRIALEECHDGDDIRSSTSTSKSSSSSNSKQQYSSLYNVPAWSMYCNGRKVGYAMRRQMSVRDLAVLKLMQSVSVGAGILPNNTNTKTCKCDDHHHHHHQMVVDAAAAGDLMYLRATFQRVIGSLHSHSFHMINPAGTSAQDLSIFLLRSSS